MIFDKLSNSKIYENISENFKLALNEIPNYIDKPLGKYPINDGLYISVQEYDSKAVCEKFEYHKNYIDIQYIAKGVEVMLCTDKGRQENLVDYAPEKDVGFLKQIGDECTLIVREGEFAAFFPQDSHAPGLSLNGQVAPVRKVLAKIAVK